MKFIADAPSEGYTYSSEPSGVFAVTTKSPFIYISMKFGSTARVTRNGVFKGTFCTVMVFVRVLSVVVIHPFVASPL